MENLAEFKHELSTMKNDIRTMKETSENLNHSFEEINTRYNVLQERMEDVIQPTGGEPSTSSKRPLWETEEEEEEPAIKIPKALDEVRLPLRQKLEEIYGKFQYFPDKEKMTKPQLAFIHHWIAQRSSNSPSKLAFHFPF